MLSSRELELAVGLFVALGLLSLIFLATQVGQRGRTLAHGSYPLTARFTDVGGLRQSAPVTVAGVPVGRVANIDIDPERFEAIVTLAIDKRFQLPTDTSASILTAGLLGEKYVGLEPGGATENFAANGEIELTQSSLVLERLIGQFATGLGTGN